MFLINSDESFNKLSSNPVYCQQERMKVKQVTERSKSQLQIKDSGGAHQFTATADDSQFIQKLFYSLQWVHEFICFTEFYDINWRFLNAGFSLYTVQRNGLIIMNYVFENTTPSFAWADRGKPWKTSISIADNPVKIQDGYLVNGSPERCLPGLMILLIDVLYYLYSIRFYKGLIRLYSTGHWFLISC